MNNSESPTLEETTANELKVICDKNAGDLLATVEKFIKSGGDIQLLSHLIASYICTIIKYMKPKNIIKEEWLTVERTCIETSCELIRYTQNLKECGKELIDAEILEMRKNLREHIARGHNNE